MRSDYYLRGIVQAVVLSVLLLAAGKPAYAQDYRFGVSISPLISWFRSDISEVRNKGSRTGYDLSLRGEKPISNFVSLTAGLSLESSGGRLVSSIPTTFRLTEFDTIVPSGEPVVYKIRYLSVPLGIKLRTREYGYITWFVEPGFDPKVVIRGRVDIPSTGISNGRAMTEIHRFNLGYHVNGGIEYSLNGSTALFLGAGFESNFFDTTRDRGGQPSDRIIQKFLKFMFGINF